MTVGARPSEGKSAFCMQLAYSLSKSANVMYISPEMGRREALTRLFCHEKGISSSDVYSGKITQDSPIYKEFERTLLETRPKLYFLEEFGSSWEDIDRLFHQILRSAPDIVFVDYIQMIIGDRNRRTLVDDYLNKFRALAKSKNFALIICSQINRASISDDKEPTMEGLKETGGLEEKSDKVLLLHYPYKHNNNDVNKFKIKIPKNKNGMTGYINCIFSPETYTFSEETELDIQTQRMKERKTGGNINA